MPGIFPQETFVCTSLAKLMKTKPTLDHTLAPSLYITNAYTQLTLHEI